MARLKIPATVEKILAKDDVCKLIDDFKQNHLTEAESVVLIWSQGENEVFILNATTGNIETLGLIEYGKKILLDNEIEEEGF